jgi:hypothetical protein
VSSTFSFKVMRFPPTEPTDDREGNFHLFCKKFYEHADLCKAVNGFVGKEVLRLVGMGIGVNCKIVDMDAWSDYISANVNDGEGTDGYFTWTQPDKLVKRAKP